MYKIPANTLFLGKSIVYVPQCHSTNTLADELSQKAETCEGTVVITGDQTSGRGQRGNSWESEPGKNLTFSVILMPHFLGIQEQFHIHQAVSLGIADYMRSDVTPSVKIKWPNDILVEEKKISGILIENHLRGNTVKYSIVGIGLNVNQESFRYPTASSLRMITGREFSLAETLETLLGCLEARYIELKSGSYNDLVNSYRQLLYRKDENHRFRSSGLEFEGMITDVDNQGRLKIRVDHEEKVFGVKGVEFL